MDIFVSFSHRWCEILSHGFEAKRVIWDYDPCKSILYFSPKWQWDADNWSAFYPEQHTLIVSLHYFNTYLSFNFLLLCRPLLKWLARVNFQGFFLCFWYTRGVTCSWYNELPELKGIDILKGSFLRYINLKL